MAKVLFILLLLLSVNFFNCIPVQDSINVPALRQLLGVVLFVTCFPLLLERRKVFFKNEYILILISYVMCSISSFLLYQQSPYESIKSVADFVFALSLYLFAIKYNFSEEFIFKVLLFISLTFLVIHVAQQFTYPFYLFCGRVEMEGQETVEIRMGLYRFVISGVWLCVLCLSMLYQRIIEKRQWIIYFTLFVIVFMCILLNLERKVIFSCFAALTITTLIIGKTISFRTILFSIFLIWAINEVLGYTSDLNTQTQEELSDSNFVRYVSMRYFLLEMNDSPLFYLFGSGLPGDSELGDLLKRMQVMYGLHQEDIGIFGYISRTGLFGFVCFFLIFYKVLKHRKEVNKGLFLFVLMMIIVCPFKFLGNTEANMSSFAVFLYLIDCSVRKLRSHGVLYRRIPIREKYEFEKVEDSKNVKYEILKKHCNTSY